MLVFSIISRVTELGYIGGFQDLSAFYDFCEVNIFAIDDFEFRVKGCVGDGDHVIRIQEKST